MNADNDLEAQRAEQERQLAGGTPRASDTPQAAEDGAGKSQSPATAVAGLADGDIEFTMFGFGC